MPQNQYLFREPQHIQSPPIIEPNPLTSHSTEYQFQLILSKLELIQNRLTTLEAKVSNIEKIAQESQSEQGIPKWKKGLY